MEVQVFNFDDGSYSENIDLSDSVFQNAIRRDIIHSVICWQLAKRRSGTHKAKQRADVACSTRKLYKQKGTGRARHGSAKAPQFRKGAVVFGPVVRSHAFSLNKKVRALGLSSALSLRLKEGKIVVIDKLTPYSCKTKDLLKNMENFHLSKNDSVLMIDNDISLNLKRAVSSLIYYDALPVCGLNVYDIIKHEKLFLTKDAINGIIKRFE